MTDEENRDLSAAVEQGVVQVLNALRFFELEWLALEDERAAELAAAPEVAADRHYLESLAPVQRRTRCPSPRSGCWPSATPQPSAPGRRCSARRRRRSRCRSTAATARSRTPSTGCWHTCTTRVATSGAARWRRCTRRSSPHTPVLAQCYDSLVGDRLVLDRLRCTTTPDHADAPAQRARCLGGRRDAGRGRGELPDRTAAGSRPKARRARARQARAARPVRPGGQRPRRRLRRGRARS